MNRNQTLELHDGRQLGFAEYGLPEGKPIFFFQGAPSSRLFHHPDETIAQSSGARVITIDRPGFGRSSYQPGRTLLDWPVEVSELADALEIPTFAVAGISAGGPYVAACAYKIPERLTSAVIISGVGPIDSETNTAELYRERQIAIRIARKTPWLLRPLIWLLQNPQRDPERYFEKVYNGSSASDQAILRQPDIKAMLIANWLEGTRQGVRGFAREGLIFANPWGFPLEAVRIPVHIWHGDADTSTPLWMAQAMANKIPGGSLRVVSGGGHFFLFQYWGEILNGIIDGTQSGPLGGANGV